MERVTDFYSIKNRNKRNSFRRGTPDAIRDAPVRSPRKADSKNKHRNQIRLIVVQFFGTPDAIRTHDT